MRPESARALKYSGESAGGLALTGVVDPPSGGGGVEPSSALVVFSKTGSSHSGSSHSGFGGT